MEPSRTVTIDVPETLLAALGRAAAAAGVGPSEYLRAVLRGALDRSPARLRSREEEIAQLLHLASDWVDLQRRLRAAGFVLRRDRQGELVIHSWPLERPLLPAAGLGLGLAALTLRFGTGFPADAEDLPRSAIPSTQPAHLSARTGRAA